MSPQAARFRFFAMQIVRSCGVVIALVGLLVFFGKIDRLGLPPEAGYGLVPAGFLIAITIPNALVRRWQKQP